MIKLKRGFVRALSFGAFGASALIMPAALAASCTSPEPLFNVSVNALSLVHRESPTSRVDMAWREIARRYNALPTSERGLPLEIRTRRDLNITDVGQALAGAIKARDDIRFNLIYDYPGVLSNVLSYKGVQPLAATADASALRNVYDSRITSINDNLVGMPKDNFYIMPLAKSSEFLSVNKPLAALLFSTAKANGLISASNSKMINQIIDEQAAIVGGDYDFLKNNANSPWKAKPASDPNASTIQFSDDIFTDAEQLINFSIAARKLFNINPQSITRGAINSSYLAKDYNVLGIDSAPNFMFTHAFSAGDADFSKFLFHRGAANATQLEYPFLRDQTSNQKQIFDRIYNKLVEGARAEAVFVKRRLRDEDPDESYSNIRLSVDHLLAFAITSTASYEYNYTTAQKLHGSEQLEDERLLITKDEMLPLLVPGQYGSAKPNVGIIQGPSLMALRAANPNVNVDTQRFIKWMMETVVPRWDAVENVPISAAQATVTIAPSTNITPAERFTQIAGYLYPSKTLLNSDLSANALYTDGQRQTAKQFQASLQAPERYSLFEEPVDFYASNVRSQVNQNILEQFKQAYAGGRIETADEVLTHIRNSVGFY